MEWRVQASRFGAVGLCGLELGLPQGSGCSLGFMGFTLTPNNLPF